MKPPIFTQAELIQAFEQGSTLSSPPLDQGQADSAEPIFAEKPRGYWLTEKQCLDWINFAKYNFKPAGAKPVKAERLLPRCPKDAKERMIAFDYLFNFSDNCYE